MIKYSTPITVIQKYIAKNEIFLIHNTYDRYYFSQLWSSEGLVGITQKKIYIWLDGRYKQFAKSNAVLPNVVIADIKDFLNRLEGFFKTKKLNKIIVQDKDSKNVLIEKIKEKYPLLQYVPDIQSTYRMIKNNDELQKIQEACRITDSIFSSFKKQISRAMTEKDLHILLRRIALDYGVLEFSFSPIISINTHTSFPHYTSINCSKKLQTGDMILLDFGIIYDGYCSDMTRMLFIGDPSQEVREQYNVLLKLQVSILKHIQIKRTISQTIFYSNTLFKKNRLEQYVAHRLGHGIGLEVHEYPQLTESNKQCWKNGMVFSIEPGIYYPDKWGMRIEDTCAIYRGALKIYTKSSKKLEDSIVFL